MVARILDLVRGVDLRWFGRKLGGVGRRVYRLRGRGILRVLDFLTGSNDCTMLSVGPGVVSEDEGSTSSESSSITLEEARVDAFLRHCAPTTSQPSHCCCDERYIALISEEASRRAGRFIEAMLYIVWKKCRLGGDNLKIWLSGSVPLSRHAAL